MKSTLTPEQIRSFQDNGHLSVEGFLTPDELEKWRGAVDEAVTGRKGLMIPSLNTRTTDNPGYDSIFIQRVNLWQDNPKIKELVLDPRIGEMACNLSGIDAVRVWHDQALIKGPWASATAFHVDNAYWSFSSRHAATIWVALDDATLENGCLYFFPGTHKEADFTSIEIGHNMGGIFKTYPQWKNRKAVPIVLKAGSCSFHNGLLAHGAGTNMTPGYRRAMTCIYMPADSTFNGQQNILSKEQMARLKVGDPLNDDEKNPIVFSRVAAAPRALTPV